MNLYVHANTVDSTYAYKGWVAVVKTDLRQKMGANAQAEHEPIRSCQHSWFHVCVPRMGHGCKHILQKKKWVLALHISSSTVEKTHFKKKKWFVPLYTKVDHG